MDRAFNAARFRDGLSQTLALAERRIGHPSRGRLAWPVDFPIGLGPGQAMPAGEAHLDTFLDRCRARPGVEVRYAMRDWSVARMHYGATFTMLTTPNAPTDDCQWYPAHAGVFTARSWHAGGVNALMADGSARFVGDTIARETWWALGTRAGGELIDDAP